MRRGGILICELKKGDGLLLVDMYLCLPSSLISTYNRSYTRK